MNIGDIFKGRARKYNNYNECEKTEGRKCILCVRWRFSYPYTCNDYDMNSDKAETCLNWTDNIKDKVD